MDALLAALAAYREDRPDDPTLPAVLDAARAGFDAALDDDLNVSEALASLFEGVRELNRRIDARTLSTADAGRAIGLVRELDAVLGVAAPAAPELDPRRCRACWTSGSRLASRATGPRPTASATSCSRAASRSRTRGTGSAGERW